MDSALIFQILLILGEVLALAWCGGVLSGAVKLLRDTAFTKARTRCKWIIAGCIAVILGLLWLLVATIDAFTLFER